ncbi:D-alanyl-D-alanine carboxypeptidase [Cellulomonas composti]|uniref:D-alanyl-D-alanine carboxypeptidase n=2 Tax=Cellulomonas composti TaxID=266130 RepID=A0A511JB92_9CELL|nr:D-alanyl-D-alanine carboxypeptidase [Cellulomonas composti]
MGVTMLVVVLAATGYVYADARDLVPGLVTLEPTPEPAAPFPTAPGAVEAPELTTALTALDPAAPEPAADRVQALVDEMAADSRLGGEKNVSVLVTDQLTGEVVASHRSETPRTPASTAKLVTATAALGSVPGTSTVATRVVQGDAADALVLVGGGDMMLAADAGDPDAVLGHAGLGDLARATAKDLRLRGVTSVTLTVDDSLFSGPSVNPDWDPVDLSLGYVAPVTSIAVNIAKTKAGEYVPRYADPSQHAAGVFADRLEEAGITVEGSVRHGVASEGAAQLAEVRSAPLADVVAFFLESSDNTITEVVARLVALDQGLPGSFDGATQAVLRVVAGMGVDTTGAHLSDASGLARGSTLTVETLDDLLTLVVDPGRPMLRSIAAGMPIGGLTGTLADRYLESPARGMVRAKTGSLANTSGLAGTVQDADGRQLVFAVLARTPDAWQGGARQAIDAWVTQVQACGCRG